MLYRVETGLHANITDTQGRKTALHLLKALQIPVAAIRQIKVYTVDGLDAAQVNRLVDEGIWHDPILQQASLEPLPFVEPAPHWIVEVGYRPGVTDNEGRTARDTAAMVLGIARDSLRVYTSVQYRITCTPDRMLGREEVEALARDLLCNTLIQRFRVKSAEEWQAQPGFEAQAAKVTGEANDTVDVVPLSSMDDEALQKASRDNTWALTLRELHCIRDQFATPDEQARRKAAGLPADPTDVEMEVLAQTWSEHCKHKIFASRIHYENKETGQREEVNNLYKTCIRDAMSAASARRIVEVLDETTDLPAPKAPVQQVRDGGIEFEHVTFKYKHGSGQPVLNDVTFSIRPGETLGIIGGTGSAKSSLVQLIPRLYDAETGSVKVGGVDVKDYSLDVLRREVSMVLQKNVLFSGTILDNLRWGDENASEEECIRVAKLACADEFIERFPDKYNTWIEQGGSNVSGGQKQRLTIARALLRKPKVLILDDSTSAVDTATDAKIRKAFREEIPGTTKIIIAQRISSVQDADRILVLDNGQINGLGTHEELLKTNKIYQEVYNSQTQGGGDFDKQGGEQ